MIGLLRGRASLPAILKLLPEPRRSAMQDVLKRLEKVPENELRARWKRIRQAEADEVHKRAREAGLRVDLMPAFVRDWIGERTRDG
jgi:hypothetical protein